MNKDNTKTSSNRQKKIVIVDDLTAKVSKAKGMVFTNYTGLTHQQLEGLKRAVKKVDGEFVVTKNTLLRRSLGDQMTDLSVFDNPTATLFAYNDIIEPLKIIAKSVKDVNMPLIKAGLLDGKVLSEKEVIRFSTLPPLPVLRAQVLGMMKSPIQGLHRSLNWNIQSFVMTLNAIAQKKQ